MKFQPSIPLNYTLSSKPNDLGLTVQSGPQWQATALTLGHPNHRSATVLWPWCNYHFHLQFSTNRQASRSTNSKAKKISHMCHMLAFHEIWNSATLENRKSLVNNFRIVHSDFASPAAVCPGSQPGGVQTRTKRSPESWCSHRKVCKRPPQRSSAWSTGPTHQKSQQQTSRIFTRSLQESVCRPLLLWLWHSSHEVKTDVIANAWTWDEFQKSYWPNVVWKCSIIERETFFKEQPQNTQDWIISCLH